MRKLTPEERRAAQFMPFAALKGYYDLVKEEERIVQKKHQLTEEEALELSRSIQEIRRGEVVSVTHYDRDAYVTTEGAVSEVSVDARFITIVRTKIAFEDILRIKKPRTFG